MKRWLAERLYRLAHRLAPTMPLGSVTVVRATVVCGDTAVAYDWFTGVRGVEIPDGQIPDGSVSVTLKAGPA